jgi:hypothetical protein
MGRSKVVEHGYAVENGMFVSRPEKWFTIRAEVHEVPAIEQFPVGTRLKIDLTNWTDTGTVIGPVNGHPRLVRVKWDALGFSCAFQPIDQQIDWHMEVIRS